MTRKKSKLWLKLPKRKSLSGVQYKRIATPLKGLTPKRPRVYSPLPLHPQNPDELITLSPMQVTQDENCHLFYSVLSKLEQYHLDKQFKSFLVSVSNDKFPLENISFLLFLETAQFYNNKRDSEMKYSEVTKRFWKVGYRLFHGKFLYFMGGIKGLDQGANINFAVPSIKTLEDFSISNIDIPKITVPGVILPVLKSLQNIPMSSKQFMLCADGKKVTSGIDSKGRDVDMFGCEDGESLVNRKSEYDQQQKSVNKINVVLNDQEPTSHASDINDETRMVLLSTVSTVISTLGKRLRDGKQLELRQKFGLEKFQRLAGPDWRNSKYIYVISGLQASLFQLRGFVSDSLTTINRLAEVASYLQGTTECFCSEKELDGSFQCNMLTISENSTEKPTEVEPRFLKQRTDVWHLIRKKARVTGSTLHNAVGLRGLKQQKDHFAKFVDGEESSKFPEEIQRRLDYGTLHEKDAIATIVGKFLPAFFPKCFFVEEGCYVIPGENTDTLCVISPDGSIRGPSNDPDEKVLSAVEIKCPFPSQVKLSVHYQLPEYYVCQCLAEMKALGTNQLLYVSHSQCSTTFFKVTFNDDLWNLVWEQVVEAYDHVNPAKPTKANPVVKMLRQEINNFVKTNVEFLCEVPSCTMIDSGCRSTLVESPFLYPCTKEVFSRTLEVSDILLIAKKASGILETGYNLLRRKATEVMVWVLSNKDRNSKLELPCSLPIAYGLKDYKFTVKGMRKATEKVLAQCDEQGVDVLTLYADGQWIQLMTRDSEDNPLTVYQLQKDINKRVQKKTKAELVKEISEVHLIQSDSPVQFIHIERGSENQVYVKLKTGTLFSISTCNQKEVWTATKKKIVSAESDNPGNAEQGMQTSWLPVQVIEELENDKNDTEMIQTITEISNDVIATDVVPHDITEVEIFPNLQDFELPIPSTTEIDIELPVVATYDIQRETMDTQELGQFHLSNEDISNIVRVLNAGSPNSKKWSGLDSENIPVDFFSKNMIERLCHKDLNIIYNAIHEKIPETLLHFKKSWKKDKKVDYILGVFGYVSLPSKQKPQRRRRISPMKLRKLTIKIISSKGYPKAALVASYCQHIFPEELSKWQSLSPFPSPMAIEGLESIISYWYSRPELRSNGKYLCKGIDCSHNLTHLRVRTCTTGVFGVSPTAWKQCARSNTTRLSISHVEDLVDKQSVPMARTNFSQEVENWMAKNGFPEAAKLTNVIRNWYNASDVPGILAKDRVRHLLAMREYLLRDVDFAKYPPKGRYFNGVPVVTFEGMLMDIDSKLQLYGLTETFNIRSVGSLAAETTVGILQDMYPSSQVSIKARDVPQLISSVVEVMTCKADPQRGFRMRTSRTSGVYPMHEAEPQDSGQLPGRTTSVHSNSRVLCPRDHYFDTEARKKSSARKINFGLISGPSAPSRGALPVRQYHRKDESKILPTKRLGIDLL